VPEYGSSISFEIVREKALPKSQGPSKTRSIEQSAFGSHAFAATLPEPVRFKRGYPT
jgi:hypothetical protein